MKIIKYFSKGYKETRSIEEDRKMGTCEQQQTDQQDQPQRDRMNFEENNLMITGPPASRTVIDNLKKLLVQRQHSRESDTENNKNVARSNSASNSDAAFYSQFSTSSSDSDDSSDDYMIFQELSNEGATNGSGHGGRRRHRRRRSYSSSSSSSPSPVARNRRKITRVNVTLTNSIPVEGDAKKVDSSTKSSSEAPTETQEDNIETIPGRGAEAQTGTKENHENDSANSTSSHKDSSSEDDHPSQQQQQGLSSSAEVAGPVSASSSGGRCPKLKSRRDRDRKRKRSELNYATNRRHRPKLMKSTQETENGSNLSRNSVHTPAGAGITGGHSGESRKISTESVSTSEQEPTADNTPSKKND